MGPLTKQLFEHSRDHIYAFRDEPFTLASGRKSRHYFNCKKITLHPGRLQMLANVLRDEIIPALGQSPQAVGGLTLGADPIGCALSLAYNAVGKTVFPLIVRKEAKGHGTGQKIEGEVSAVKEVLVLDDVITTAGSTLQAVRAFREAGLIVNQAICIVNREEGGEEALKAEGVQISWVFKKSDFSLVKDPD
ncbi:MAG: orotate phosphoribosyltransferase [Leptospirales bacterium]|nr:orotate phosphoribosyltransferase [Leptospirales bacterium]